MALIMSTILSAISGSINGTVFARNASGAYARNRTVPVNPNTSSQIQARSALGVNATAWKTLTDAQRNDWREYAAVTPVQNRIGQTIHLSGFAWYVKINTFLGFAGLTLRSDAPALPGVGGPIINLGVTADVSEGIFEIVSAEAAAGFDNANAQWSVWVSPPQSAGRNFYKGPWNYLGSVTGDSLVGTTFAPVTPLAIGQIYFYRARYIDASGRLSAEWISDARGTVA